MKFELWTGHIGSHMIFKTICTMRVFGTFIICIVVIFSTSMAYLGICAWSCTMPKLLVPVKSKWFWNEFIHFNVKISYFNISWRSWFKKTSLDKYLIYWLIHLCIIETSRRILKDGILIGGCSSWLPVQMRVPSLQEAICPKSSVAVIPDPKAEFCMVINPFVGNGWLGLLPCSLPKHLAPCSLGGTSWSPLLPRFYIFLYRAWALW